MPPYKLWIYDKDPKGAPLDRRILRAAEQIGPAITRYRGQEIDCESTSNAMLQSAVEAASKATRDGRVDNPPGYLTTVYKRIVDRFLDRRNRLVSVDDAFLEDLLSSKPVKSSEKVVHDRLLLERLLDSMDPDTRQICLWRLQGYAVREIAAELGITPNCLSTRYTRGVKKAVRKVLERDREPSPDNGRPTLQAPGSGTTSGTGVRPPDSVSESGPPGLSRHRGAPGHRDPAGVDA